MHAVGGRERDGAVETCAASPDGFTLMEIGVGAEVGASVAPDGVAASQFPPE